MRQIDKQRIINTLVKARQEILTRGWTKGQLFDEKTGRVCAVGALNAAVTGDPNGYYGTTAAGRNARNMLSQAVGQKGYSDVAEFNDDVAGRRNSDRRYVLRAFNKAIELANQL